MSATAAPTVKLNHEQYQHIWIESACEVLGQISGSPFEGQIASSADSGLVQDQTALCMHFSVGVPLGGEQALFLAAADGLRLSQLLMGEPLEPSATFDADHRDALAELFRQIAGSTALALGAKLETEVKVTLIGADRPTWLAASPAGVQLKLTSSQFPALSLNLQLNSALKSVLAGEAPVPKAKDEEAPVRHGAQQGGLQDSSLDFLRDIELGVTLRFGKRHVLLRDILEIVPGSVVELEQQVQEPVELLVGKRVIARGEVVVVGGNYGLRITEVISAVDRIESLRN
jgi:flagellar motor switch protein FliN/FliY